MFVCAYDPDSKNVFIITKVLQSIVNISISKPYLEY